MRATSLPTARTVAAAAFALMAAAMASLSVPSAAMAERWLRPVPGEVARPFDYARAAPFAAGAHRGADLAAAPGTEVRSACAGRVVHAGAVAGPELVVSVRCGSRRVSYLPLRTLAVRAGAAIRAGARLGSLAAGHGGLHLGVRREADAFGYEDPMPRLAAPAPAPPTPPALKPPARRARPKTAPRPVPTRAPQPARPAPATAPQPSARPRRQPARPVFESSAADRLATWPAAPPRPLAGHAAELAPWPVWLGLATLLTGAVGSATIRVRRRAAGHRARAAPPVGSG